MKLHSTISNSKRDCCRRNTRFGIRAQWLLAVLLAANQPPKTAALVVPSKSCNRGVNAGLHSSKQPNRIKPSLLVLGNQLNHPINYNYGFSAKHIQQNHHYRLPATSMALGSADVTAWSYMSLLALQFAFQPLLTRTFATKKLVKTTYVIAQDMLRFLVCASLLTISSNWKSIAGQWTVASSLIGAGLPASLYAIQNYCSLIAYQNLSPLSYNVLNQTKTLSAAFFCYILLSKPQSKLQLCSLVLLLVSALVMEEILPLRRISQQETISNSDAKEQLNQKMKTNHFTRGVLPILMASLISGLAGTLCQQTLQEFGRHPLLFTMEISFFSSLFLVSSLFTGNPDGKKIVEGGVAQGWNRTTLVPLFTNALGGILVGLVTLHAGSVRKGFALAIGLLLSGIIQNVAEESRMTGEQWVGGLLAAVAIWMHVSFPVQP